MNLQKTPKDMSLDRPQDAYKNQQYFHILTTNMQKLKLNTIRLTIAPKKMKHLDVNQIVHIQDLHPENYKML